MLPPHRLAAFFGQTTVRWDIMIRGTPNTRSGWRSDQIARTQRIGKHERTRATSCADSIKAARARHSRRQYPNAWTRFYTNSFQDS